MSVLQMFINKFRRSKVFVIDETHRLEKGVEMIESQNISADGFSDYKTLLYKINKKKCKYRYGLIYENGSKYKPQMICHFIKSINPNIKLFIYKNDADFTRQTACLALT
jgi:Rad3-related DNA helicase